MSEFYLFSNIIKKIGFFITKFKNNEIDKNHLNKKMFVILNLILKIKKISNKKINKILPNHNKIINNIYSIEYELVKNRKIDPKIKNPNDIKLEIERIKKFEDEIITNEINKVKKDLMKDLLIPTLNFYIPFNYLSFTFENDYYNNIINKDFIYNNNCEEFVFEQEPILNINNNNNNFETDLITNLIKLNEEEFIQNNNNNDNNDNFNDNINIDINFDNNNFSLDFKEFKYNLNLNSSKISINNNNNNKEDEISYNSMNISNVKTSESSYSDNQNIFLYKIDFEEDDVNFSICKKFQTISLKTFNENFLDFKKTENLLKLMNIEYLNLIFNFFNIIKNQSIKTVDFLQDQLFLNYIKAFIFKIGINNKNDYDDFLLIFNKKITFENFVEYFNKILNSDNKIIKIKYLLYLIIYSNDNKLFFDNINQPENYKINENQINFLFSFFSCNVFKNDDYFNEVKKNLFNLYNNRYNVNNVSNNSNESNYVNKENNCLYNEYELNKFIIILEIINESLD